MSDVTPMSPGSRGSGGGGCTCGGIINATAQYPLGIHHPRCRAVTTATVAEPAPHATHGLRDLRSPFAITHTPSSRVSISSSPGVDFYRTSEDNAQLKRDRDFFDGWPWSGGDKCSHNLDAASCAGTIGHFNDRFTDSAVGLCAERFRLYRAHREQRRTDRGQLVKRGWRSVPVQCEYLASRLVESWRDRLSATGRAGKRGAAR